MQQQQDYVVRFAAKYFFVGRDEEGRPTGTEYPSFARLLTYRTALEIARSLRTLEYPDAVVCTIYGTPALPEDVAAPSEAATESSEFKSAWGLTEDSQPPIDPSWPKTKKEFYASEPGAWDRFRKLPSFQTHIDRIFAEENK